MFVREHFLIFVEHYNFPFYIPLKTEQGTDLHSHSIWTLYHVRFEESETSGSGPAQCQASIVDVQYNSLIFINSYLVIKLVYGFACSYRYNSYDFMSTDTKTEVKFELKTVRYFQSYMSKVVKLLITTGDLFLKL